MTQDFFNWKQNELHLFNISEGTMHDFLMADRHFFHPQTDQDLAQ